jgi:alpha-1,4-digalacturonate transport system substrate-binding protein
VSGPFINRTLFEQAGIPIPSDESDSVTWDEWTEAARAVRDATGVQFAMAMDRSGHRFAGPAISEGALYFNDEGYPALLGDAGFRRMAERMVAWHVDGTMPLDVWAGGDSYRDARNEFINGELVFYFTGNWQIGGFQELIGDAFDWQAVPNPCGEAGCGGMGGGSVLAAIGATQHPEEVTRFMEFFASEPVQREWAETLLLIPQHTGLIEAGLNFNVELPQAQAALELFAQQTTLVSEVAVQLQAYEFNSLLFNVPRDRLTQVFVGELTLDEAIEAMQQDIDTALQQETQS